MFILSMSLISKAFPPDSIFGRDRCQTAAKNRMAFDAERPQENLGRKPRLLRTLEAGSSRPFLGQARRGQSQAGKADCGGVSVPELSPGPPDEPDGTDECAADGQQAGGNRE